MKLATVWLQAKGLECCHSNHRRSWPLQTGQILHLMASWEGGIQILLKNKIKIRWDYNQLKTVKKNEKHKNIFIQSDFRLPIKNLEAMKGDPLGAISTLLARFQIMHNNFLRTVRYCMYEFDIELSKQRKILFPKLLSSECYKHLSLRVLSLWL